MRVYPKLEPGNITAGPDKGVDILASAGTLGFDEL